MELFKFKVMAQQYHFMISVDTYGSGTPKQFSYRSATKSKEEK